jgi:hypothetical protein
VNPYWNADEEARAEAFREGERKRKAFRKAANARLAAPSSSRVALEQKWEAVRLWLAERREK